MPPQGADEKGKGDIDFFVVYSDQFHLKSSICLLLNTIPEFFISSCKSLNLSSSFSINTNVSDPGNLV